MGGNDQDRVVFAVNGRCTIWPCQACESAIAGGIDTPRYRIRGQIRIVESLGTIEHSRPHGGIRGSGPENIGVHPGRLNERAQSGRRDLKQPVGDRRLRYTEIVSNQGVERNVDGRRGERGSTVYRGVRSISGRSG